MIESRDGVYSVGGTPCKQLIERAIAMGWATRPKSVIIQTVIEKEPKEKKPWATAMPESASVPMPAPTPKSVQPMTLEDRARAAGMTVDQLLDMRMRTKARTQSHEGEAQ